MDWLNDLPDEMIEEIAYRLPLADTARLARTNQAIRTILQPRLDLLSEKATSLIDNPDKGMKVAAELGELPLIQFFIDKGAEDWGPALYSAVKEGHIELADFFISKEPENKHIRDYGLKGAARVGNRAWIQYFIDKGLSKFGWALGLTGAAKGGHRALIDFFLSKQEIWYEEDLNEAMLATIKGRHLELMQFFLDKLQSNRMHPELSRGAELAAEYNYPDLIAFFRAQGGDINYVLRGATRGHHIPLIEQIIAEGAIDWDNGMIGAILGNHSDLVDYFLEKGATDWDLFLYVAATSGNTHWVRFFTSKGADLFQGMIGAIQGNHNYLIKYFNSLGVAIPPIVRPWE